MISNDNIDGECLTHFFHFNFRVFFLLIFEALKIYFMARHYDCSRSNFVMFFFLKTCIVAFWTTENLCTRLFGLENSKILSTRISLLLS